MRGVAQHPRGTPVPAQPRAAQRRGSRKWRAVSPALKEGNPANRAVRLREASFFRNKEEIINEMRKGLKLNTNSREMQGRQRVEFGVLCPQTVVNETKTMIWERQQILFLEL